MKKTLLISVCALLASSMSYAQVPATWNPGDEVTADLGIGDCQNGEFSGATSTNGNGDLQWDDMGNYWKGTKPTEFNNVGAGAIGIYFDGKEGLDKKIDIYQVAKFPAGWYTVQVQALYREGTQIDTYNNYNAGTIKKNAWLYVDVLAGEDAESDVVAEYKEHVRSLPTSGNTTGALYTSDSQWTTWKNDYSARVKGYEDPVFCPQCLEGAKNYFTEGYYDETEFMFMIENDANIRLGIKKTENIAQDWTVFTNLRVIYNGPADETAKIQMLLVDFANATNKVEEISADIENLGFPALAMMIADQIMEISEEVEGDDITEQVVRDAIEEMTALYDSASIALYNANNLAELIEISEGLTQVTDFDGKAEFQLAIEDIKSRAGTDDVEELQSLGGLGAFITLFKELSAARAEYASTSPVGERNDQDFTILIKYPWFVNTEYTPIQLTEPVGRAEVGTWLIQQNGDTTPWHFDTVAKGATEYSSSLLTDGREDISSKVMLSGDETVVNQWYKRMNFDGWSPGLKLMYQGGLIGVSDGSNSITGGANEVVQQLEGLPVGYYSIKALMRGNTGQYTPEWDEMEYHNIFAENSEGLHVASPKGHPDSYYSSEYGWSEWNSNVWQEHKTGILNVPDGKLLIGAQSTMTMNVTGFRLSFYGTEPPVNTMIQDDIQDIEELLAANAELMTFKGDVAKVKSLIASIQLPLAGAAAYEEALKTISEARNYIIQAVSAMKAYTLPADYATLVEEHPTAKDMLNPAVKYAEALGTNEGDTYTLIAEAQKVYNAYKNYLGYYENAMSIGTPALKEEVAKERGELAAAYATVDQLNGYVTSLNLLVNRAFIEVAGGLAATEAAPVEITGLVKNPDFNEKGRTELATVENINGSSVTSPAEGWSGTEASANGCSMGNVELWNKSSIDFYQTLEGMPEGTYEIRVRALYRDARNVTDNNNASWTGWWIDANGDVEAWKGHNAVLYAKGTETEESTSYVKSICDGKFTEPSFVLYPKTLIEGDLIIDYDEFGNEIETVQTDTAYYYYPGYVDPTTLPELPIDPSTEAPYTHDESTAYPFDEKIEIEGQGTFYYPSSMYGAYCRFKLNPEAYCNSVRITIGRGESLRFGFKKDVEVSGDWVIFDDFQLFYLGGLDQVGITEVNVDNKANGAIYNIAGQKVNNAVKGIYIQNGKKVYVK